MTGFRLTVWLAGLLADWLSGSMCANLGVWSAGRLGGWAAGCLRGWYEDQDGMADHADHDAVETSGKVPGLRSDFGNDEAYNGLRTRCVPLSRPTNMTKLRKQGQTTSIQRKQTATTQKTTPSWSS
ncbi:unnamed protein product [Protopolystoma xenopodis]|uniref:Secreted protein n=1 Tax=Protopolystoma xenopodis TaxID=117903 RepID=A0A3S5C0X9_9PLAT|nr:unnamed protein product [Protopolystoma xenopodis]